MPKLNDGPKTTKIPKKAKPVSIFLYATRFLPSGMVLLELLLPLLAADLKSDSSIKDMYDA